MTKIKWDQEKQNSLKPLILKCPEKAFQEAFGLLETSTESPLIF